MPATSEILRVPSGDLALEVREHSPAGPGRPTVVLVHGYPDQQDTWAALIDRLPLDSWHVVTYDVRGAGRSDAPAGRDGYRTQRLVDDLVAVLDAVLPDGERVHLLGHDWGSAQLWDALAVEPDHPGLRGRIATYTSVSGFSLDHAGWLLAHRQGRRGAVVRQLLKSWYVGYFCLPVLPALTWRLGHRTIARVLTQREGLPADHWGPGLRRNAVNGLELYRANILRRVRRPRRLRTDVPVLVVYAERDGYISPLTLEDLDVPCADVRVERLDAGHWCIVTHPDEVAALLVRHVAEHP
ncbi:MAG: alpha/beta fold hydrolase [Nocardioidaceae bacterium]|nr:alpha/beta fold hydrolase [Nocardioidaceae bacterium]